MGVGDIMIDLHIHTNYSDGTDDLISILKESESIKLKLISITDHDTCDAYEELENIDFTKYYSGEILNGVEITTSFQGTRIELLGYGFSDYKEINNYLRQFHTDERWNGVMMMLRQDLITKLIKLDLKYDEELLGLIETEKKFESYFYNSILERNDNLEEILGPEYCESGYDFFRKCVLNPESQFYMNYSQYNPKVEDIISLIQKNDGKVFLAHPFVYNVKDIGSFMDKLYPLGLDGIECFHYSYTKDQINWLINYVKKNNLLISGGSDYHGKNRKNIKLGVGRGNLEIPKEIIDEWNFTKTHNYKLELNDKKNQMKSC